MGGIKLLLSQTRRLKPPTLPHLRYFSTSDPSPATDLPPDTRPPRSQTPQIQPVSYSLKPKDLSPPPPEGDPTPGSAREQRQERAGRGFERLGEFDPQARTNWSREDARYMKDDPQIAPFSYAARVAPLPDDEAAVREGGEAVEVNADVAKEHVRMERRRRMVRVEAVEEDTVKVPFPRLIIPVKREKKPLLELMDAIRQVKANGRKTFDETLEAHAKLGIEKSRSDLIVRGTLTLPHGDKKVLRVAVFAEGADAEEAKAAGADVVGGSELINEIANSGKVDFDKCFTTRQLYPRVAKVAKILNRHGLMPDAKQGTVVSDVSKAVKEAKKNQIKFRMDKSSIVHVGLGKLSFSEEALRENVGAFMDAILQAKPAGLKKTSKYAGYITSFNLCSTMGPGFPISVQSLSKAVDHYHKVHLKE